MGLYTKKKPEKSDFLWLYFDYYKLYFTRPIINPTTDIAIPSRAIKSDPKYAILTNNKLLLLISFLVRINVGIDSISENITYFIKSGIAIISNIIQIIDHIFIFSLFMFNL